jgi:hypothetical protein
MNVANGKKNYCVMCHDLRPSKTEQFMDQILYFEIISSKIQFVCHMTNFYCVTCQDLRACKMDCARCYELK